MSLTPALTLSPTHTHQQDAVNKLAHDVMMVQALGDKDAAIEMTKTYAVVTPELKASLDRLVEQNIPVDIVPMNLMI